MVDVPGKFALEAIGYVNSPFKEKFAIPRQPGLVTAAKGTITLTGEANHLDLVQGLEQFSHVWLLFMFHGNQTDTWKAQVRPPRLGGNKKMGVLATRSPFRPNPIGMSVVKLNAIENDKNNVVLHISGFDLLDKTPIIDIKPYIPYSDALANVDAGFAQLEPEQALQISFSDQAEQALITLVNIIPELKLLIQQVLAQDPRPAYKKNNLDDKVYGMSLYDLNISWKMQTLSQVQVLSILKI